MSLKFMYITNDPFTARVCERAGVDRVWIDLEYKGKEERQKNKDTVKSFHSISDISIIKNELKKSQLLVRVNPYDKDSKLEIDGVIDAGADIIMLPMAKTYIDCLNFVNDVNGRVKTILLLETKSIEQFLGKILNDNLFDEIHIGLNDLSLSYGLNFMFQLISNGVVERICNQIRPYGVPYGFGGIGRLGQGIIPSEYIIPEHYRLGSTRAILSRSFFHLGDVIRDRSIVECKFIEKIQEIRSFEAKVSSFSDEEFTKNFCFVKSKIDTMFGENKSDNI
ncbi:aldolase [Treponema sp. OMZ 788]|uniref:aldolase/citrate lyase family protein n=1 Tax=Treponema sp. OMZ 788 TaxID=2563664 RepID=UPI0020A50B25|nr:aldolase/citrate lyase family protein [Treponema sp. OMZ 788]UTC65425.1 aldolase [Treponema sp. OMZ 788]